MQQIQQNALKTFETNLLFLEKYDHELFKKIIALNSAIELAHHSEKYSLEYKDGYFDVLELSSGNFLYGVDSNKHAEISAKSINYKKNENSFATFNNFTFNEKRLDELENSYIDQDPLAGTYKLMEYSKKVADQTTTSMKKIYKFIFLGVGLGLHISKTAKRLKSFVYFIVEDDLELFRLSLFVTNYKELSDNGAEIVFSVFDDDDSFVFNTKKFLKKAFIYNHYIKFFHLHSHLDTKLKLIQNTIASQLHLLFDYSALAHNMIRPLNHLKHGYKFLDISKPYIGTDITSKPILFLAAGPSLGKNLEWLKLHHNKFIVVALSATLAKLEQIGIRPDIITHLDGFDVAMKHIEKIKDFSFFDDSLLVAGAFTQHRFLKKFKKENIYLHEVVTMYKNDYAQLTASNVGITTLGLLLRLGAKEVFLLGLDMALDQDSGATHSDFHSYTKTLELKTDKSTSDGVEFKSDVVKAKGNLRDEVFTTIYMKSTIDEYVNIMLQNLTKHTQDLFNLSDGVYFPLTKPLEFKNLTIGDDAIIDKHKLSKSLRSVFDAKSQNYLNPIEIMALEDRVEYCNHLLDHIDKQKKVKHKDIDSYHYDMVGFFKELLSEVENPYTQDLDRVTTLYMEFVGSYVFDIINTKETTNTKEMISKLDDALYPEIKRVVEFIKEKFEIFLLEVK